MKEELLKIINIIRDNKALPPLTAINDQDSLRKDIGFSSFDLAELTVRIEDMFDIDIFEDGLVSTVHEILERLNIEK